MKYFSYDPNTGFERHDSAAEATAAAAKSLAYYYEDAEDGWGDVVDKVCWGIVCEAVTMSNKRSSAPGSKVDYLCDYELKKIT